MSYLKLALKIQEKKVAKLNLSISISQTDKFFLQTISIYICRRLKKNVFTATPQKKPLPSSTALIFSIAKLCRINTETLLFQRVYKLVCEFTVIFFAGRR